jgi:hypothetical protein
MSGKARAWQGKRVIMEGLYKKGAMMQGIKERNILWVKRPWLLSLCLSLPLLLFASPARAQPKINGKKDATKEEKKDAPKVKVERGRGGKKVYKITQGFVIEGRIQKPNAFYVLQRSQINYDWAALKQKFVPRILEAVRKSPF